MGAVPEFFDKMFVQLIRVGGNDLEVARSAWVSTRGDKAKDHDGAHVEGLINYLMRDRHGSPFEQCELQWLTKAPIFVWREHYRHRMACLTGDTRIYFETAAGTGYWKTIEEHWDHWHNGVPDTLGRRRKLPAVRAAHVRSFNEVDMSVQRSPVLDVVQSGMKPVFRLTTHRGFEVTASADHPFLGPAGWMQMKQIHPGYHVFVQGRVSRPGHLPAVPKPLRHAIQTWVTSVRDEILDRDGEKCRRCRRTEGLWRIDHILPVVTHLEVALDKRNLQVLCVDCDREKTSDEQQYAQRPSSFQAVTPDIVVSVEPLDQRMTYDIVLPDPWHNFLANGIVTHNSYNEQSGRYMQLEPHFYVPNGERNLVQKGKTGAYIFEPGTEHQIGQVRSHLMISSADAYERYEHMLESGIAKEVARMVLPLTIYSSAYVKMNLRALMNFLSLRTKHEGSTFPSFPQREIEMVAELYEQTFAMYFPLVYKAFCANGRVAP